MNHTHNDAASDIPLSLSRRAALASLGAMSLGAGLVSAAVGQPGSPGSAPVDTDKPGASGIKPAAGGQQQDLNGAGFYRFTLGGGKERGGLTLSLLTDGWFPMGGDDGSPFPLIGANQSATRAEVEAAAADVMVPPSKVIGHVHALLIDAGPGKPRVLVDTGCGTGFGPTTGRLALTMSRAGYEASTIDAVVLTHLHPDHVGGLMDGEGLSRFPKATFYLSKEEHAFWSQSGGADLSKSPLPVQMRSMMKMQGATLCGQLDAPAMKGRVVLFGDNDKVADHDGLRTLLAPGHTPGHSGLRVSAGGESMLYLTDFAHYAPIQLAHPDWQVAYDVDGKAAAATRRRLLDLSASEKSLVCGSHLPFPAVGRVRASGSGFVWVPRVWEW